MSILSDKDTKTQARDNGLNSLLDMVFAERNSLVQAKTRSYELEQEYTMADQIRVETLLHDQPDYEPDCSLIYCGLTGQPLGRIDPQHISMMLNTHGLTETKELLRFGAVTSISPAWRRIGGEQLERLSTSDPFGYFVYAANHITKTVPTSLAQKKEMETADYQIKLVHDRIYLYQWLKANISADHVISCNEVWHQFLSLIDPKTIDTLIDQHFKDLREIANLNIMANFKKIIKDIMLSVLKKRLAFNASHHFSVSPNKLQEMKGISIFRSQSSTSIAAHNAIAIMGDLLMDADATDIAFADAACRAIDRANFDHIMQQYRKKNKTQAELKALVGSGTQISIRAQDIKPIAPTPKKLTLAELIARKKGISS